MATNNYNGIQQGTAFQNNGFGNNYNNYDPITPTTSFTPPPISIGFVQGKMGAGTFPVMSSNTTVYLFDVQDQSKFYIKATDAFGMAMPLRKFEYHEVTAQVQPVPPVVPAPIKDQEETVNVSREEFDALKEQLAELMKNNQRQNYKSKKEHVSNV